MFYELKNGKLIKVDFDAVTYNHRQYVAFIKNTQREDLFQSFGLSENQNTTKQERNFMIFESHTSFDYIRLNKPSYTVSHDSPDSVHIYFKRGILLFADKNGTAAAEILGDHILNENLDLSLERLLMLFFERLTFDDTELLETVEQEIFELENAILTSVKRNFVPEIISLRRRLMSLKRHYEQLLDVLDLLQENQNGLFSDNAIRFFKIFSSRVDRIYRVVLNLRDYVTQVRESLQAEVDIGLNKIMKIFTAITAIFLPLTLIVGWYGMNFDMPEYRYVVSYPLVAILCVAVIILCLVYFKKHKWF